MKKIILNAVIGFSFLFCSKSVFSQEVTGRPDKFYTMSGFGFSIPVGEISDVLKPKFSTTIGVNLGLGDGGLFLYPKLSLHAFSYSELYPEEGYDHALQTGRATTYLLNVALGYRKIVDKFSFYGFIGGGGGFILTPQITIDPVNRLATLNNKSRSMGLVEPGLGVEYNMGGVNLFLESSYMHGFGKIQDRTFSAVPVTFGIKPNLSRLFNK